MILESDDTAGPNPCEGMDSTVCADFMPRKIPSSGEDKAELSHGPSCQGFQ